VAASAQQASKSNHHPNQPSSSVVAAALNVADGAECSTPDFGLPPVETTVLASFERNVPALDVLDIAFHDAGDESESLMPLSPSSSSLPSLSLMKESAKASAAQVSTTC
jgi:hypothetical protein